MTSSPSSSSGRSDTVSTSRSGGSTSRYAPVQRISRRSGPQNIVARQAPPGRTSIATVERGTSHAVPPNQSAKRSGSVHSFHTRSRGAAKTRFVVNPRTPKRSGSAIVSQPLLHAIEASLPERAVGIEPFRRVLQGDRPQARRPQLRAATALDQAGALEHAQVLADR